MLYNINHTYPTSNVNFAGKIPKLNSRKSLNRLIEIMAQTKDTKMEPVKYSMQRGNFVYLKDASGQNTVTSRLIPSYYNMDSDSYCIFFHDSFNNITNYQDFYKLLNLQSAKVLAVEYPGYGSNKQGKATIENIEEIAQAAYNYLTKSLNVNPQKINIIGHSFGASVAANLAKKVDCNSVTLISPVTTFSQLKQSFLKHAGNVPTFFNNIRNLITLNFKHDKLNVYKGIDNIKGHLYVISSSNDPVTNIKWVDKLVKHIKKTGKRVTYIKSTEKEHTITRANTDFISELIRI